MGAKINDHGGNLEVATISCDVEGEDELWVRILDFDFFDDENVVLIIKPKNGEREGKFGHKTKRRFILTGLRLFVLAIRICIPWDDELPAVEV